MANKLPGFEIFPKNRGSGEWLELSGIMSKHAPPHRSGKSTGNESVVKPFAKYLVVYTILYTIIGCLNSEVSLKWQLKMDEDNLLKLTISRKINQVVEKVSGVGE